MIHFWNNLNKIFHDPVIFVVELCGGKHMEKGMYILCFRAYCVRKTTHSRY